MRSWWLPPRYGFIHPNTRRILRWTAEAFDYPNTNNTGPTGALSSVSGTLTISINGTTVQNEERTGQYVIQADNVTIRNCKVIRTTAGSAISQEDINNTGLLVEDCEFSLGNTVGATAISSFNYTIRRCEIYGGENHLWAETNCTIEDNYLHDNVSSLAPGGPHTDGIQIPQDADNITVQHNTVYGGYVSQSDFGNSAITVAETSQATDILINNNLLAGGGASLRLPVNAGGVTWTNNRFSRIFVDTVGGFGTHTNGSIHTNSGNVYHETGEPITP